MCGIAGFIDPQSRLREPRHALKRMTDSLAHRGPDDSGHWIDADAHVALGHRRLSIVDLSPEGHQPMRSASGRYTIVYNGEIYNHADLRREFRERGCQFRGHSDTEVMLAAFETFGVRRALESFIGMFAFALWDSVERRLVLGRDRIGKKPLYFGWQGGVFYFASEFKGVCAALQYSPDIERGALCAYFRYGYIPAPLSIYDGFRKLDPGSLLGIRLQDGRAHEETVEHYWSPAQALSAQPFDQGAQSEAQAIDRLESLMRDSIRIRMVADVPVGAFLSGGIDSSAVVAIMQSLSPRPVKTFSIGFDEKDFDEANYARNVGRHLRTDHTSLIVRAQDAIDVIPSLPRIYDEPFADASQLPTYLVAKLARREVIVSLSGDGGDELFGGYSRYFVAQRMWRLMSFLPRSLRSSLGSFLLWASGRRNDRVPASLSWLAPLLNLRKWIDRAERAGEMLRASDQRDLYLNLVSHVFFPERLVRGSTEPTHVVSDPSSWPAGASLLGKMGMLDLVSYLPDDILVKLDRATMAVSLEGRVPLLDHRIVEFALRLPEAFKVRNGESKWLLRQVLYRHVPRHLVDRPKTGFGVPIEQWLRGPLRDWGESLLEPYRLRSEGILDVALVRQRWSEHLQGVRSWHYQLWDILMFQAWHEWQRSMAFGAAQPPTSGRQRWAGMAQ